MSTTRPALPTRTDPARPRVALPGPLGLGGAPLGNLYAALDDAVAAATLEAAWDAGLRYFDTAPFYGMGLSEHRLGALLRNRPREDFVVSTKVGRLLQADPAAPARQHGYVGGLPFRMRYDYSRDATLRSIDDSLARLGLARLDIVFIHDVAEDTHGAAWTARYREAIDGAARALSDLRDQQVIRGWGLGVNAIAPCLRALEDAEPDLFLLAGRYSLLDASAGEQLMPACTARGVGLVIGGPYNSGLLAGGDTYDYARASDALRERRARIADRCAAHGVDLKAAALQFCAVPDAVAAVVAGARTPGEVRENARLMQAPIPPALWDALKADGLLPVQAPVPGGARRARPAPR